MNKYFFFYIFIDSDIYMDNKSNQSHILSIYLSIINDIPYNLKYISKKNCKQIESIN